MIHTSHRLFSILVFLFVTLLTNAQNISFKHLTIKEELSHYSVMAIYQDERGLLWFGTRNGVSVYNGYDIDTYRHDENNPNSIQSNHIRDIIGDKNGHIYFLTIRGICMFDIHQETFTDLANDDIGAIYFTDNILYTSKNNEIYQWKEGKTTLSCQLPSSNIKISSLYVSNDSIFIGTEEKGLYLYSYKNNKFTHLIPQGRISKIMQDQKGQYWIGTWDNGLYTYINGQLKNYTSQSQDNSSLCSNFVRTFCEDLQGNMWIGTFRGLSKYQPQTDNFVNYKEHGNLPYGMTHSSIWSMICDHQGTLWFGTYFGGINYFNPSQNITQHHLKEENSLHESVIGAMTEDNNHNLWICTEGNGLYKLNRNNGAILRFKHSEKKNSISHNNLKSIFYDSKRDVLWIGTHMGGLNKFDIKKQRFTHYSTNKEEKMSHNSDIICDIVLYENNLLLATHDGIYQFDIEKETFSPMLKNIQADANVDLALDLHIDHNNRLWIAGAKEGAFVYDLKSGELIQYKHTSDKESLSSNGINCLYADSKHRIWFGTAEKGIDLYDPANNTFTNYNETNNQLLSNCIYGICEIATDKFIFLTDNGFCYLDVNLGILRNYKANSNLPLSAINQKSIYQTKDGELFIGGLDGMISFRLEDLNSHLYNFRILPHKLFINDREIKANDETGILKESLSKTNQITLDYDQSMISITYSITNYYSLSQEDFIYKLENFSDEWTTLRNGRMITYTNLNPGEYTLIVKSNQEEKIYSKLNIKILPPWYQTYTAYAIYLLVSVLILYIVISIYKNRIRLQASLEYERKRAKDIETMNQHKLRFFTNISHEFRTPLTLITSQIELLLQVKSFVPAVYNRLLNAYKNSLQLQSLISELLDFRKQEQGLMKIKAYENNIVHFLHENYLLFQEYAIKKHIKLTFHSSHEEIMVWYDEKQMQKVINNLLSNAFQYTPKNNNIDISIRKEYDHAIIEVKDTGCGIPNEEINYIFNRFYQTEHTLQSTGKGIGIGLALTKGIVELHHGTITATSEINKGTSFMVTLPLGKKHFKPEEVASIKEATITFEDKDKQELLSIEDYKFSMGDLKERSFNILIAEDDPSLRDMLKDIFTPYYNVTLASNGEEALSILEEKQIDIIVTDISMPGISGIEFCKKVKDNINTCHIPIVLLTALTTLEHKLEGIENGADDYITKPFEINLLLARCRNLINNRLVLQEKFSKQPHTSPQIFATNTLDREFMDKVIHVIDRHMDDPHFNVNQFAQEMCIARTKLFVKLKGITGKTPNDLILSIRLKKAVYYLTNNPEMNITEISEKTGFSSPRYFSKCFKNTYNVTPQSYRKENNC